MVSILLSQEEGSSLHTFPQADAFKFHLYNVLASPPRAWPGQALCQMLSDLSGLEIVLRPGFEQATVNGLISICNEALGIDSSLLVDECIRYTPKKDSLIHKYHPVWLENRMRVN